MMGIFTFPKVNLLLFVIVNTLSKEFTEVVFIGRVSFQSGKSFSDLTRYLYSLGSIARFDDLC